MADVAPNSYCAHAAGHPFHGPYHDREYGFPVHDESALFERLLLEINQAGLSWLTILNKREGLRSAYAGFDPERVAAFDDDDRARLLADPGIIRNRLKVEAAIHNAARILEMRDTHGSFAGWLAAHQWDDADGQRRLQTRDDWVKLFKRTFRFTGGEITGEFLLSIGMLPGAHDPACPAHARILELGPPWLEATRAP